MNEDVTPVTNFFATLKSDILDDFLITEFEFA